MSLGSSSHIHTSGKKVTAFYRPGILRTILSSRTAVNLAMTGLEGVFIFFEPVNERTRWRDMEYAIYSLETVYCSVFDGRLLALSAV